MKKLLFLAAIAAVAMLSACKGGSTKADLKTDVDTVSSEIGMANMQGIEFYFKQMGIDSAYIDDFIRGVMEGAKAGDDKKKQAFYLGVMMGQNVQSQMIPQMEQRVFAGDSTQHLNVKNFLAGIIAGIKKDSTVTVNGKPLTSESAAEDLNGRVEKLLGSVLEKRYPETKKAAETEMQNFAKNPELKPLGNGVYYKVITEGKGEKPKANSTVEVIYEGKLTNDTIFDSSERMQPGKPIDMPVNGIIKGLQGAFPQMPVGSVWEIYIPYQLGYGAAGSGPIPPFSNLIFKIDLRGVKAGEAANPQIIQAN